MPKKPGEWFDLGWFEDWEAKPSPSGPPPSDRAIRRKARQVEKSLGVRLLGDDPATTAAGLASFGTLWLTALAMILRDPHRVDLVLVFGLLASSLAQAVGFLLARDRTPAPPAPPPTPTPGPEPSRKT